MIGGAVRRLLRLAARVLLAVVALWLAGLIAYRWIDPPLTPLMLLRLPSEGRIDYRPRPLAAISPALVSAVIAAEDNRFCRHAGVDWQAVRTAVDDYRAGGRLRGASTITMQTARNLFLWPGGGYARKAVEAPLALSLDMLWPKRRILEVYLNVAELGPGIYGAEAAAQAYFGKPAAQLGVREAARLAAVLPNPRVRSAARPGPGVARQADVIVRRIGQLGPLLACAEAP